MIVLKNERDLDAMRPAGAVAGTVLEEIAAFIKPGLTTRQVDEFAAKRIKAAWRQKRVFGLPQLSVSHVPFGKRRSGARSGRRP